MAESMAKINSGSLEDKYFRHLYTRLFKKRADYLDKKTSFRHEKNNVYVEFRPAQQVSREFFWQIAGSKSKSTWKAFFEELFAQDESHDKNVVNISKHVLVYLRCRKDVHDILQQDYRQFDKDCKSQTEMNCDNLDLETDRLVKELASKSQSENVGEKELHQQTQDILEELRTARKQVKDKLKVKQEELEVVTAEREGLKGELERIEEEVSEKARNIEELEQVVSKKDIEITNQKQEIQSLRNNIQQLQRELDLLKHELELKTEKIAILQESIETKKLQVSMYEDKVSNLRTENQELLKKYKDDFKKTDKLLKESAETLGEYKRHVASLHKQQRVLENKPSDQEVAQQRPTEKNRVKSKQEPKKQTSRESPEKLKVQEKSRPQTPYITSRSLRFPKTDEKSKMG